MLKPRNTNSCRHPPVRFIPPACPCPAIWGDLGGHRVGRAPWKAWIWRGKALQPFRDERFCVDFIQNLRRNHRSSDPNPNSAFGWRPFCLQCITVPLHCLRSHQKYQHMTPRKNMCSRTRSFFVTQNDERRTQKTQKKNMKWTNKLRQYVLSHSSCTRRTVRTSPLMTYSEIPSIWVSVASTTSWKATGSVVITKSSPCNSCSIHFSRDGREVSVNRHFFQTWVQ